MEYCNETFQIIWRSVLIAIACIIQLQSEVSIYLKYDNRYPTIPTTPTSGPKYHPSLLHWSPPFHHEIHCISHTFNGSYFYPTFLLFLYHSIGFLFKVFWFFFFSTRFFRLLNNNVGTIPMLVEIKFAILLQNIVRSMCHVFSSFTGTFIILLHKGLIPVWPFDHTK